MASIYDLKPGFQSILRPITKHLANCGVSPNQVTLLAMLASIATGYCVLQWPSRYWPLMLVPVMLFVRMALNAIDGMLAREHGMKTNLGAILNEIGDVISDCALYLPLALVPGFHPQLMVIIVVLSVVSEMMGVVAIQIGSSRRYDGPMGKSDRAFAIGLPCLLMGCGISPDLWLNLVLISILILLGLTIYNRGKHALQGSIQ